MEGKIRGKARPRICRGHAFTPKTTVDYENKVRECYIKQEGKYLEGSIKAIINAYYKIPKSYTKKRVQNGEKAGKNPEIVLKDCIKVILDALNRIAYEDDKQVVQVIAVKKWTEDIERVEFSLEEIKQGN